MPRAVSVTRLAVTAVVAAVALQRATAAAFELEQVGCLAPGALRGDAALSGDGRTAVFSAAADLLPGSNPLGIPQLFALDLVTRVLRQLTPAWPIRGPEAATCVAVEASVSGDGTRAVSLVACGRGPGRKRWRLFDHQSGARPRPLGGWTRCAPRVLPQSLSADGRRLVVSSGCNPAPARDTAARWRRQTLWQQARPDARTRPFGPRGRCETLAPALDRDGGRVAFLSDCDATGENPSHAVNLFTLDRAAGLLVQRTHAVHQRAGGRCGAVQAVGPIRSGLFETPALAAAGAALLVAPCLDETDPGEPLHDRLFVLAPGAADFAERAVPACHTAPALRALTSPVSASADAGRMALVRTCVLATDLARGEQALVLLGSAAPPRTLLANAGFQVAVQREIRRPSLDASGRSLLVVSAEPPPGCPDRGPQLVLARELDDPVLRGVVCGCAAR